MKRLINRRTKFTTRNINKQSGKYGYSSNNSLIKTPMITTNNYFAEANKIGIENLPDTFKKSHELVKKASQNGSNWNMYNSNQGIKKMIDMYFEKLSKYEKTSAPKAPEIKPKPEAKLHRSPKEKPAKQYPHLTITDKKEDWLDTKAKQVEKKIDRFKKGDRVSFQGKNGVITVSFTISKGAFVPGQQNRATVEETDHKVMFDDGTNSILHDYELNEEIEIESTKTKAPKEKSPKATKPQQEATQSNATLVERIEDEISLIKRYINFHNKQKARDQVYSLLKSVQKAILERRVNKNSRYGKEVMQIQDSLIRALKHDVSVFDIKIEKTQLEHYTGIVTGVAPMSSIQLIKRYIGLQNKTGIIDKVERLRDAVQKWFDENTLKNDKYYKYLAVASNNLNDYRQQVLVLKNKNATLKTFTDAELNGLGAVTWKNNPLDKKMKKIVDSENTPNNKHTYRAKVLRGEFVVLKELGNTPVKVVCKSAEWFDCVVMAGYMNENANECLSGRAIDKRANKKYSHFVFDLKNKKILSGWEYLSDAQDNLNENLENYPNANLKIYTAKFLKATYNMDAYNYSNWSNADSLGFIPTIIAAAAGATVQAIAHHHLNKKTNQNLSGTETEVMSVADARNETFKEIGLTGDFLRLIGRACAPTSIFIYGNGGSGKSGLALKLADQLHQLNHSVLYAAGEQYGTPTFTELLRKVNISGGANFKIVKSLNTLPIANFDVIVIDSKESANMNKSSEFKQLRDAYPDKIWLITSQGTKAGDYAGDGKWKNEVDAFIYCENGKAKTIDEKNRWGGKAEIKLF